MLDEHVSPTSTRSSCSATTSDLDVQTADSRTLVTLLHVRDILRKLGSDAPVVSEMLDDRNRVLASVADVDDVVVSGEIVSLVVTQLSEDGRLEAVFKELLGAEGSEIYLRPAEWYVQPGEDVTWATVVAGATAATRPRSGSSRRAGRPGAEVRRRREPAEVADLHDRPRATGSSCWPRTDPPVTVGDALAGPARADRVEPRRPAHLTTDLPLLPEGEDGARGALRAAGRRPSASC